MVDCLRTSVLHKVHTVYDHSKIGSHASLVSAQVLHRRVVNPQDGLHSRMIRYIFSSTWPFSGNVLFIVFMHNCNFLFFLFSITFIIPLERRILFTIRNIHSANMAI